MNGVPSPARSGLLQQDEEAVRRSFVMVAGSAGVPGKCRTTERHVRIRDPHLLEFIDSADWNAACLG